jgi:ribosome maturation factor RimP
MSVDDDGLITVEIDGKEYEVELKNVDKIQL